MVLPQGALHGTSRTFSRSLPGRTSACQQLLEAKEAEIGRLRSELESWLAQRQLGLAIEAPGRRPPSLSAKERQQQDSAKAAARASRTRSIEAAKNLEQARERLRSATRSLEGMEAYRSELSEAMHEESSREALALAALINAEQRDDEEKQEIASEQWQVKEASEEALQLRQMNRQEAQELGQTQIHIDEIMLKQEACRAVLRQQRRTCQQLLLEKEAVDDELRASRPALREEQAEQAAAFDVLEEEVQALESLEQRLPLETREVLNMRRQEHESWKAELGHTEQELWVAQRQLREQQKKNTGTLASCRRQAQTQEARARAEAAQSFAAQKKTLQEAEQHFNKLQEKIRHQATRERVNNAFKAPIFQQRQKGTVERTRREGVAEQKFTGSQRFALAASQHEQDEQGAENQELAYLEDRIHRLCREDQWLMAECRSVDEELKAMAFAQSDGSAEKGSGWDER